MRERVVETGLPLVYLNRVGGQDELVFDGSSFVTNDDGSIAVQMPDFEEAMAVTDWVRTPNGWRCEPGRKASLSPYPEDMYRAMMVALRDYVGANGFPGVILGLSGGIDSALSAAVAVDALGADKVWCVMLPSKYTVSESLEDAAECARLLGVRHDVIPIVPGVGALDEMLAEAFADGEPGLAAENIQSRLRMVTLMALSNRFGHMLLTTGNKSEMSVGYATLYGDMAGGYSVLKDAYKTTCFALSRWRNANRPKGGLGPDWSGDAAAGDRQAAHRRAPPQPEGRGQPAALSFARPDPRGAGREGNVGQGNRRPDRSGSRRSSPTSRRSCFAPNISAARPRPGSSSAAATSAATAAIRSPTPSTPHKQRASPMTRLLPIFAFLLIAACDKQDASVAPPANEAAAAPAAPSAPAEVPSLEGDWRVTMIEGRDVAGIGMTASIGGGKASISTGCLRRAWTYTQNRNVVAFTASPGASTNCGRSPSGDEETAYAAINDANMAIFGKDGKEASLSGTGGTLTLQRR